MRLLISIFIIFTVAVRPVLPLVNYAVNYDYIVKNLCENRNIPQSTCKGKCYVEKELAKTEKQSTGSQNIKIAGLDVFLSHDIFSFTDKDEMGSRIKITDSNYSDSHTTEYFSRVFHPPLV
ncbi:hypothetical protein H3Z85_09440 [Chryseobacterium indologenes]|uniref:hypothetical protein n=1 Tax=Chryseobacterium indologenes TaxID=253 RepID=UPI000554B907|nr:hypothetical protein [Chryseobacterium indologenes]ATN07610.1 hypothetical protein CRN76_20510 [Chryseobacterium indologenes]AYY83650.1 hypothetical protein EGX91_03315 [Chryseobacterium indologenes]QIX80573.1 hypothetical protein FOB56_04720 [Chryseobacterium indologenes]QPQ53521.1 hypothetical protein H3Z85_09440 [Chryseobacterium indologenes]UDQ54230.1 hypothetical protein LJF28_00830 [Chryseobacterium indologenes]